MESLSFYWDDLKRQLFIGTGKWEEISTTINLCFYREDSKRQLFIGTGDGKSFFLLGGSQKTDIHKFWEVGGNKVQP